MYSSDPEHAQLAMGMKEARDATKLFPRKARFQGVMKSFDHVNTEAVCAVCDAKFLGGGWRTFRLFLVLL